MRSLLLLLLLALIVPARALAWSDDPFTPEGWAWAWIKAGAVADFNEHCGKTLDPHEQPGWDEPCRQISPQFLVDVLTAPKWQSQVPLQGVRLRGAHVVGDIDLRNAEITVEYWLDASLIAGTLYLINTHLKHVLSLRESVLNGALIADRMNAESDVILAGGAYFADDARLLGAKVGGDLEMDASTFSKTLNANKIDVRRGLYMRDHASFAGDVDLVGATVGSNLEMETASFSKALNASNVNVHGAMPSGRYRFPRCAFNDSAESILNRLLSR